MVEQKEKKEDSMGLLGGLFKSAVDVVALPFAVAEDILTENGSPNSDARLKALKEDLEETLDGDIL
jgi:hypothetical protein